MVLSAPQRCSEADDVAAAHSYGGRKPRDSLPLGSMQGRRRKCLWGDFEPIVEIDRVINLQKDNPLCRQAEY